MKALYQTFMINSRRIGLRKKIFIFFLVFLIICFFMSFTQIFANNFDMLFYSRRIPELNRIPYFRASIARIAGINLDEPLREAMNFLEVGETC